MLDDERARLPLTGGGEIVLERRARTATYRTPGRLDDGELIHPLLAPVGAVFARWLGRQAFHAGAFLVGGEAWVLLGDREAGKSTLLASLHASGHAVVTDDVLVVEDRTGMAGPRSIDLRQSVAARLGMDAHAGSARSGTRERVALPPIDAEVPLAGWIFLEWGELLRVAPITAAERLGRLSEYRLAWQAAGGDPFCPPELAALPAWELRRPRRWDCLPSVVDRLASLPVGA